MKTHLLYLVLALFIYACSPNNDDSGNSNNGSLPTQDGDGGNSSNEWLIPISLVRDGGPGKDGIPSIDNPKFIDVKEFNFLTDNDLVIGIVNGNEARAYPHIILDWHEVVNDEINGEPITINYCPLTGTAFGWESTSNGSRTTFGVSGLLYNNNLILYDRNTDSNWSQLRLECVNGTLISNKPTLTNLVETDWKTWKTLYPDSNVLSLDTGFSRSYGVYPYGDYKTNNSYFLFSYTPTNSALPTKKRIYAIINNERAKVYKFEDIKNVGVVRDNFINKEYLIVGNDKIINSFELNGEYASLEFEYVFNNSQTFFKDNEGNSWSVFGTAIAGPRLGETLTPAKSVVSYWFAIAAFYPNPEIYGQ